MTDLITDYLSWNSTDRFMVLRCSLCLSHSQQQNRADQKWSSGNVAVFGGMTIENARGSDHWVQPDVWGV